MNQTEIAADIDAMRELPCPFENDDEAAAATALGILNQHLSEAATHDAQSDAIERIKLFMEHEQSKRSRR